MIAQGRLPGIDDIGSQIGFGPWHPSWHGLVGLEASSKGGLCSASIGRYGDVGVLGRMSQERVDAARKKGMTHELNFLNS